MQAALQPRAASNELSLRCMQQQQQAMLALIISGSDYIVTFYASASSGTMA